MKKFVLLLVFLFALPLISNGETSALKLRASKHPEFLRIVLEGEPLLIDSAMLYKRQESILVKFPDKSFSIEKGKIEVPFAIKDNNSIIFTPGAFKELNAFMLNDPSRLVLDVYPHDEQEQSQTPKEK